MANQSITIQRRLRPLRLAFLVRPGDTKTLRTVLEINACLWGGRYNGIIPVFKRTPAWWDERKFSPPAREIVRGYLQAFEPDYIVTPSENLAAGLGFEKERTLNLADVLAPGREDHVQYGLSVIHLYRDLYDREFQFIRRHPMKVMLPQPSSNELRDFTTACFGAFPGTKGLEYFRRGYKDAFDAGDQPINGTNLLDLLTSGTGTPLRMGAAGLNVRRRAWSLGPTLFFMDATKWIDLVDFWNLRALGWEVFPVPKQWADVLVAPCQKFK